MANFIIASEAIQDLKGIIDCFATRNVETGEKLPIEFKKKCHYLVQFPQIGRKYQHIHSYLRGLPLDGYIIFYRLTEEGIEIMRVVKGNRDLEALFNN